MGVSVTSESPNLPLRPRQQVGPQPGGNPAAQPPAGGNPQPAPGGNPQPAPGGNPQPAPGGNPQPAPGGNPQPPQGGNPPPAAGGNGGGNANPNGQPAGGPNAQSSTGQSASSSLPLIPATAPAGGILFTQPPQTAAPSFYKIAPSQPITFGWNMTSVILTPSQLTVSAFCSENGNTYPVGPTDGVIPGTATEVVWDPYSYQQAHPTQPLIAASYTLQIMDNHGLTQAAAPGRFQANTQMTFALYKPQSYTPLASWTCNGCSSAPVALTAHPIFLSLVASFLAMILGGWGVLRRR